jgi:ADP-heptose:LPS heptosyltransferase
MSVHPLRPAAPGPHVLVVRLDNDGDVLLTGPAVRAVAAGAGSVTMLCGPRGRQAAALLPGVDAVLVHRAEWIDHEPPPVDPRATTELVGRLREVGADQAIIFTSFHQSALPTALLLRLAGVPVVAAISEDYPGSLLNIRHRVDDEIPEVERNLSLAATLGYRLPAGDDGRLAVDRPERGRLIPPHDTPYVVVHPGASAPARAWAYGRSAALVQALTDEGWAVAVTGGPHERALTAQVAGGVDRGSEPPAPPVKRGSEPPAPPGRGVADLGGTTSLAQLAEVIAGAAAVIVGNTGPAHLAAAVGTPVVSLYAPTVPAVRWRPWKVPHELLYIDVPCAGCRAHHCPIPGHPCLSGIDVSDVLAAVRRLAGQPSIARAAT